MVKENHALDERLEYYNTALLAICSGSGEPRMGPPQHARVSLHYGSGPPFLT